MTVRRHRMGHMQRLLAVSICAALFTPARTASAQPPTFVQAVSELTAAVAGTYGDEGAQVIPAIDKMAAALAQWDRELQSFETEIASERRGATSAEIVRLRTELARRFAARGRMSDAFRELDAASTLDPLDRSLLLLRGQLLEASSRTTEAGETFRNAWAGNRQDAIVAYGMLHDGATGDPQDVHGATETLLAAYRARLADGAHEKSRPFSNIDVLQPGSGDTPAIAPLIYGEGYARLVRREYGEAVAAFRRAAATDPLVVDSFSRSSSMTQAVAALRQGRTTDARSLLERAEGRDASSEAHRVLGLIHWADARYDQSVAELMAAIRGDARDERSRVALSRVLSSDGRQADAERALHETLQVLPDSALARAWLGATFEENNRFAEARQAFERVAPSVIAGRAAFFASIARLAAAAGDYPGATEALRVAIAASPNDPELHKQMAHALLQQDRADEALGELVAASLIDPLDGGAHLGIGRWHLAAGRNADAVAALRRAVQLLPEHTEARYALATALSRIGKADEAAQEFERVEQAQRRAIDDRRRALALATLKEEAALRTDERNYERATLLWQQAIQREPSRASNYLQLAVALEGNGRIETAIEQYEIALRLGADPLVYRHLAELYTRLGRPDEASRARALYTGVLQGGVIGRGGTP